MTARADAHPHLRTSVGGDLRQRDARAYRLRRACGPSCSSPHLVRVFAKLGVTAPRPLPRPWAGGFVLPPHEGAAAPPGPARRSWLDAMGTSLAEPPQHPGTVVGADRAREV